MSNVKSLSLILALLANTIWGSTFLASSEALKSITPFALIFCRFTLAAIFLILFSKVMKLKISLPSKEKFSLLFVLNSIVSFVLIYAFQMVGLQYISTGLSASIMLLSPLIVVLISSLLKLNFQVKNLIGVSLGIVGGLYVIFNKGYHVVLDGNEMELEGILYTFFAAIFLAISSFISKKLSTRYSSLNITFWSILGAIPCLFFLAAFELNVDSAPLPAFSEELIGQIVYLSFVCSAIAFFLWNKAIELTDPSYVASSMHIKTPVAILLGIVIAHEAINQNLIFGVILIFLGLFITKFDFSRLISRKKSVT